MTGASESRALPIRTGARSFLASPGIWMLIPVEVLFLGFLGSAIAMRSGNDATIPALLTIAATVPVLLELESLSRFPPWLHGFYLAFLLAGPFAGAQLGFYSVWDRWDKVIHTSSGVLVGFATVFALGVVGRRQRLALPPALLLAGILAAGGFVAAVWEIAEFSSDHLVGTRAQNGSLEDTMADIICGMAGATAVGIAMGIHLRGRRFRLIASLLRDRDFTLAIPGIGT